MDERERLRAKIIENAAEINRLHRRIHETVKKRGESDELRQEWSQACEEFHAKHDKLCVPGGWDERFLDRIVAGDLATIEIALCFSKSAPISSVPGTIGKPFCRNASGRPVRRAG